MPQSPSERERDALDVLELMHETVTGDPRWAIPDDERRKVRRVLQLMVANLRRDLQQEEADEVTELLTDLSLSSPLG